MSFKSSSKNYRNKHHWNCDCHWKVSENHWRVTRELRDALIELGSNEIGNGENMIAVQKGNFHISI